MLHPPGPAQADVFITDELARRAPKKADHLQEKRALQDLAARMADDPDEVLPRFVDLAMRMTGGTSAGLSLYEEEPWPGVFRWHFLRGVLSPFEGATTPRHDSPCGITLDRNAPVLARHAERFYAWIADADITVPEVLLVPLYLGGRDPLGTLWIVSDEEGHFDGEHARVAAELATFVGIALRMRRGEQRLREALDQQEMLAREMSHRVRNLFAVTDSMIRFSAKGAGDKDEMARLLSGRLQALARAHALVRPGFGEAGAAPHASDLGALIRAIVQPHEDRVDAAASRVSLEGPPFACGPRAVEGLALVLHELATNAAKHGALTAEAGRVDIRWRQDEERLVLRWAERGGPRIEAPPARQGFGSRLVHNTIVRQLRGAADRDWRRDGLAVTISMPVDGLLV
jgi:two-component sensor histidine kinase